MTDTKNIDLTTCTKPAQLEDLIKLTALHTVNENKSYFYKITNDAASNIVWLIILKMEENEHNDMMKKVKWSNQTCAKYMIENTLLEVIAVIHVNTLQVVRCVTIEKRVPNTTKDTKDAKATEIKDKDMEEYESDYNVISDKYVNGFIVETYIENKKTKSVKSTKNLIECYKLLPVAYFSVSYVPNDYTGEWFMWYASGELMLESNYVKGKRDGLWYSYYRNGNTKSMSIYEDNYMMGIMTTWYENGIEQTSCNYVFGERIGDFVERYENGNEKLRCKYFDDKKNGTFIERFRNGIIKIKGEYLNDEKEGEWRQFYDNGLVKITGSFHRNKKHGVWKERYANGKRRAIATFVRGKEHGDIIAYGKNGEIVSKKTFVYGLIRV